VLLDSQDHQDKKDQWDLLDPKDHQD